MEIKLEFLKYDFTVCKVRNIPPELLCGEFCFIGKTDNELSLACPTDKTPPETLSREDGWIAFRVAGALEFSLIGILAPIASLLADAKISIFAISTYDTDYILIKKSDGVKAKDLLSKSGYIVI